jgi:hypothetical protein
MVTAKRRQQQASKPQTTSEDGPYGRIRATSEILPPGAEAPDFRLRVTRTRIFHSAAGSFAECAMMVVVPQIEAIAVITQ